MAPEYTVGEWRIRQGLKVLVRIVEYKSHIRVDVRQWYLSDDGEWCPGRSGVGIPVERLADVQKMLERAASLLNGKVSSP
jgi:Transcriptional Coactivator p15 (PC4)